MREKYQALCQAFWRLLTYKENNYKILRCLPSIPLFLQVVDMKALVEQEAELYRRQ